MSYESMSVAQLRALLDIAATRPDARSVTWYRLPGWGAVIYVEADPDTGEPTTEITIDGAGRWSEDRPVPSATAGVR